MSFVYSSGVCRKKFPYPRWIHSILAYEVFSALNISNLIFPFRIDDLKKIKLRKLVIFRCESVCRCLGCTFLRLLIQKSPTSVPIPIPTNDVWSKTFTALRILRPSKKEEVWTWARGVFCIGPQNSPFLRGHDSLRWGKKKLKKPPRFFKPESHLRVLSIYPWPFQGLLVTSGRWFISSA